MPLSKDNHPIKAFLEGKGVKLTSKIEYGKVRDSETHQLTHWLNGDRIMFAEKVTDPLPRVTFIGDSKVRIFHEGQPPPGEKLCTRCFSKDHFRGKCPNAECCVRCRKPGHQPGDPICGASLQEPQADIVAVQGKDDVLSNFYPCEINIFGITAKSAEHAYQFSKAVRRGEMIQVLEEKAAQVPEFKKALKKSGSKRIVETVRNETYWASGLDDVNTLHTKPEYWLGKNRLGEIQMELRDKLKNEAKKFKEQQKKEKRKEDKRNTRSNSTAQGSKGRIDAAALMPGEESSSSDSEINTG